MRGLRTSRAKQVRYCAARDWSRFREARPLDTTPPDIDVSMSLTRTARRILDARTATGIFSQFARFSLVGGFATVVHYGCMGALVIVSDMHPVPASAIGFSAAVVVSYLLNHRFTFRNAARHNRAVPRFVAVALIGLGLNCLFLSLLVEIAGLHWLAGQVLTTLLVLAWNFWVNRCWTFSCAR